MNNTRRSSPLILIVGMHRSGTSLLGSLLTSIGVSLPGDLIEANNFNPSGYYERHDITSLQEELLIDLGRWWPSNDGLLSLPCGWMDFPRTQRAAFYLRSLLAKEHSCHNAPWAIKDPRTSLLLPLWRQVCEELGIPLKILVAIREPSEVASSLVSRDHVTTGMSKSRAFRLWVRHHSQVLFDSRDLPLHIIDYGTWFSNPSHQLKNLYQFCFGSQIPTHLLASSLNCINSDYRRSNMRNRFLRFDFFYFAKAYPFYKKLLSSSFTGSVKKVSYCQYLPSNDLTPQDKHPWNLAFNSLNTNRTSSLEEWIQNGIPSSTLSHLRELNIPGFPGNDPSSSCAPPLPAAFDLEIISTGLPHSLALLWAHQLPTLYPDSISLDSSKPNISLHLQSIDITAANPKLLLDLCSRERVFDPDPLQVRLFRLLGVNAELLTPRALSSFYVDDIDFSSIGLPDPSSFHCLDSKIICLGTSSDPSWFFTPASICLIPRFPDVFNNSLESSHTFTFWLLSLKHLGYKIVRLNPASYEQDLWQFLKIDHFDDPISPSELLYELTHHDPSLELSLCIDSPAPSASLILEKVSPHPLVSILISSYNYADRITKALSSCQAQSFQPFEIIVVDDSSTDHSHEVILDWFSTNGHLLSGFKYLRHKTNNGLAAARNTAFAHSSSSWCWVLDADNEIDPKAVESCFNLAKSSSPSTAVVHPLIRILDDDNNCLGFVGGGFSWHKELLKFGNNIDAMALVRQSAWESVGGYSHIPGGWEDFDFWCKLIDADYHGILCPQVLATYRLHRLSMLQSSTNSQQRRLSRILKARHPWLQLALS